MKKLNKRQKTALACGAAVVALAGMTMAIYTAREDSDFVAVVGTIDIDVHDPSLTNQFNINPGDGDPNNPQGAAEGTSHRFEYTVSSYGSKSMRTRQSIILTICDKEQANLLDARYAALYRDGKEIGTKSYILADGTAVDSIDFDDTSVMVKAIRYSFLAEPFDGYGIDIKEGGKAEKEDPGTAAGLVQEGSDKFVRKTYGYDFVFDRRAGNEYKKAIFQFDVFAEGMQYRNTDDSFWSTFYTDEGVEGTRGFVSLSSADVKVESIPNRDQHDGEEDGNGVEKVENGKYPDLTGGSIQYDFPVFDDAQFNVYATNKEQEEAAAQKESLDKAAFESLMHAFEQQDKALQDLRDRDSQEIPEEPEDSMAQSESSAADESLQESESTEVSASPEQSSMQEDSDSE